MVRYLVAIECTGDPGQVECVIDEILASISFMDLSHVGVTIESTEVLEHD